jgi:hypothetical protein
VAFGLDPTVDCDFGGARGVVVSNIFSKGSDGHNGINLLMSLIEANMTEVNFSVSHVCVTMDIDRVSV